MAEETDKQRLLEKRFGPHGLALRRKMAELAEPLLWHHPPFDTFQYVSKLDLFMPYIEQHPPSEREKLVQATIDDTRADIGGGFLRGADTNSTLEPIRKILGEKYWRELDTRKNLVGFPDMTFKDLRNLLTGVMKERLPDYKPEKLAAMHDPAVLAFAKPFSPDSKLLIRFDRGTMRPSHFTPSLGLTEPWYEMNFGYVFGKPRWTYSSDVECRKVIHEMIDIIEKLMPIFVGKVLEALGHKGA
jgi:hypothetical protein